MRNNTEGLFIFFFTFYFCQSKMIKKSLLFLFFLVAGMGIFLSFVWKAQIFSNYLELTVFSSLLGITEHMLLNILTCH